MPNLTRDCPQCGKLLTYKYAANRDAAENKKSVCGSCGAKTRPPMTESTRAKMGKQHLGKHHSQATKDKMSAAATGRKPSTATRKLWSKQRRGKMPPQGPPPPMLGAANPMYGRTIRDTWIEKYGVEEADRRVLEHAEKSKRVGSNNGMKGKSIYSVWLAKHGVEEANRRMEEYKAKQRENSFGVNNPMHGKPSPKGSGNGVSGWYRGYYFRSLLELSYMLELDRLGKTWESGEQKRYAVPYGDDRHYFPDFYIPAERLFVEVKPSRLLNSQRNPEKFAAAREVFHRFEVMTEKQISKIQPDALDALCVAGTVKLIDRWKARLSQP